MRKAPPRKPNAAAAKASPPTRGAGGVDSDLRVERFVEIFFVEIFVEIFFVEILFVVRLLVHERRDESFVRRLTRERRSSPLASSSARPNLREAKPAREDERVARRAAKREPHQWIFQRVDHRDGRLRDSHLAVVGPLGEQIPRDVRAERRVPRERKHRVKGSETPSVAA